MLEWGNHSIQRRGRRAWPRSLTSPLFCFCRLGWQLRANLLTGFSMEVIFAGQILSGAGLYYAGSPEWRNVLVGAHRILGVLLPLGLAAHWLAGTRWAKKFSK